MSVTDQDQLKKNVAIHKVTLKLKKNQTTLLNYLQIENNLEYL